VVANITAFIYYSAMTIRAGENLDALLARLQRAATARGKKAELAKFLRVSPQQVNSWLTSVNAPNGEVTLLMQQWVIAQENNKNAPGSATNTAKGKTRSPKSAYEKSKRIRRKK
jgi:hypothetical protein